jgi:diaminopimelate decarboxylase
LADEHKAVEHERVAHFGEIDGELAIGGIPLTRLAARVGSTPFYAYDRRVLAARVEALRSSLPREIELHYAMKANPMPALVGHMVRLVDGLDVASGGELRVALDAGADPRHVSIAGPGKSAAELEQAVAAGVLVNVEAFREVDALAEIADRLRVPARVAVRVNPSFELKRAGMSMGGGAKQFGVDAELVPELLEKLRRAGLGFEGFHLFAGSQSLNAETIAEAQRLSFALALELAAHAPSPVRILNLGGGFGIPYFPGERSLDLAPVAAALRSIVADAATRLPEARIVLELGRYLVGEAGVYVAKIVDRKVSRGRVFLVTDGGLHHHLSASGNFGQVVRKNFPVAIGTKIRSRDTERANVVGPLCTPLDILCSDMPLPKAEPGDLVVVFQSGAYGASASPQAFLSHPRVVEVLV